MSEELHDALMHPEPEAGYVAGKYIGAKEAIRRYVEAAGAYDEAKIEVSSAENALDDAIERLKFAIEKRDEAFRAMKQAGRRVLGRVRWDPGS